jgi:NADH-quinone oxidoreductase subunit B
MALKPLDAEPDRTPPPNAVVVPPAQIRRAVRSTDLDDIVMTTRLEKVLKLATANSVWPFGFGLACCAMEMIAVISSARYDVARFGSEVVRATPRQSDLMIVSGRVAHKMAACSSTGGMFANYSILQGVDKIVPVDVYVPGCPPRPEAVMEGLIILQEKVKAGIPSASKGQETQA